jgi:hypothetical protein
MAGKFGMAGLLQIVDKAEEVVAGGPDPVGGAIGDTEEFDGIVVKASFYGPVAGRAYLDEAVGTLELLRGVGIRQGVGGNAQEDQLAGIILVIVEAALEPRGRVILPECREQSVAKPVEEQDR